MFLIGYTMESGSEASARKAPEHSDSAGEYVMANTDSGINSSFFEEEIRSGYLVSGKMKRIWAVQIDLLEQLKRVCSRHHLTYFADSGTLLGAVRHQGYIPWDDDIDIVMKRADYQKLIEIAPAEFKAPYFLQSAHSEVFPRGYARLRNDNTTAITAYDLDKDIHHGIFIDIFPLDNLPDDEQERSRWFKQITFFHKMIRAGVSRQTGKNETLLNNILIHVSRGVIACVGYSRAMQKYEKLCSRYDDRDTKYISYVAYSKGKKKHIWESACFDSAHEVPFEYTTVAIPDLYDSRLRTEYGDYMTPVRAGTAHGDVIFEPEIPYREYLKDHPIQELSRMLTKVKGGNV